MRSPVPDRWMLPDMIQAAYVKSEDVLQTTPASCLLRALPKTHCVDLLLTAFSHFSRPPSLPPSIHPKRIFRALPPSLLRLASLPPSLLRSFSSKTTSRPHFPSLPPSFAFSHGCFEMKPFIATLVVLTLLVALYQLPPPAATTILSTSTSTSTSTSSSSPQHPPEKKLSSPSQLPQNLVSIPKSTANLTSSLPIITPSDPNKRVFTPYGNAAALFVQMGAYRGGPHTFAVIGLASKPLHVFARPWFKCEYISNNQSAKSLKAKSYKMLPDWGYGRIYTVVVVNCTFSEQPNADNADIIYIYL